MNLNQFFISITLFLKAINTFIGSKKYFFGDKLSNLDAALFGMLCQFIYNDNGPLNQFINGLNNFNFSLKTFYKTNQIHSRLRQVCEYFEICGDN